MLDIRLKSRLMGWLGLTIEKLGPQECPYMGRIICWLGPLGSLRFHRFYRSDSDRHLHDHPWWFITFPLQAYTEWVPSWTVNNGWSNRYRKYVGALWFHYRPAKYTHAVIIDKPGWTIVYTGTRQRGWGFWLEGQFMRYKEYFKTFGAPPCVDPK